MSPANDSESTPAPVRTADEVSREEFLRTHLKADEWAVCELRVRGLDWAAIAERLGGTPDDRRKTLSRALMRVRDRFVEQCGVVPADRVDVRIRCSMCRSIPMG